MNERSPRRTIRRRLAAWFALFLFLTVIVLGVIVSVLLERELNDNVDQRLEQTAESMISQFGLTFRFGSPSLIVPPPDAFAFPSQLIQVVDSNGIVWFSSENLGDRVLPGESEVVESGAPSFRTVEVEGVNVRTLTYPIVLNDQVVGAVIAGEPLIQLSQTLSDLRRLFLVAAIVSAALAAASGWFIAGRALKPVSEMTSTAGRIGSGQPDSMPLSARLDVPPTRDELARLASTFNDLLERLQESVEIQRLFLADASHELRTPLTAMRGNIDLLRHQLEEALAADEESEETLRHLERESARMNRLIDDLLTLARSDSPTGLPLQCESLDLLAIIQDAITTASAVYRDRTITIESANHVVVQGDRDRLEQTALIILDNAARYAGLSGAVAVTVQQIPGHAVVTVTDSGPGMDADSFERVFDRFYRADGARDRASGGVGLGLAIAKAIITGHDGSISAAPGLDGGTRVTFTIPLDRRCLAHADGMASAN